MIDGIGIGDEGGRENGAAGAVDFEPSGGDVTVDGGESNQLSHGFGPQPLFLSQLGDGIKTG